MQEPERQSFSSDMLERFENCVDEMWFRPIIKIAAEAKLYRVSVLGKSLFAYSCRFGSGRFWQCEINLS